MKHSKVGQRTHGMSRTPTYEAWRGMFSRCYDTKNKKYPNYGARGITVCERWNDFCNFFSDMGEKPSRDFSLDRIDVNGNYEPSNCRWATAKEQANNKTDNLVLEHAGRKQTLFQWAEEVSIHWSTIRGRLQRGWSTHEAITTPVDVKRRNRNAIVRAD